MEAVPDPGESVPLDSRPTRVSGEALKAEAAGAGGTLVLLDRELKPDTKKRLTLGKALAGLDPDVRFDVYRNEAGPIVLDPHVSMS